MSDFDPELRRKLARGTTRDVLDRAFRIRAGIQGALGSCLCDWPIAKHATPSEHAELCPASAIIASQLKVEAQRLEEDVRSA